MPTPVRVSCSLAQSPNSPLLYHVCRTNAIETGKLCGLTRLTGGRATELSRSKSTTQAPETRKVGPGGTTTSKTGVTTRAHTRAKSAAAPPASTRTSSRTATTTREPVRPHSALSGPRKQTGPSIPRPITSLDTHDEEHAGSVLGKRKGRRQSHQLFPHATLSPPGRSFPGVHRNDSWGCVRNQTSLPDMRNTTADSRRRESSLCTVMEQLTLDQPSSGCLCHQPLQDGPKKPSPSKLPLSTPVKHLPNRSLSPPKKSFKRHPSPIIPFLSKDSTIKAFNNFTDSGWDLERREKHIEELMNTLMTQVGKAGQDSFGLKETVELYKTRGKTSEATCDQPG